MVSGARREGRKQGALITTLPSCLWQATSPCKGEAGEKSLQKAASPLQGEAREGKAYGPFTGRKEQLRACLAFRAHLARSREYGGLRPAPPMEARAAGEGKWNAVGDAGGWLCAVRADSAAGCITARSGVLQWPRGSPVFRRVARNGRRITCFSIFAVQEIRA